jgi:hypothetical protein
MLVAVPQINPHFAHVNALFLQPTPWCSRNCNGCYVKGFEDINGVKVSQAQLFKDILKVINRVSPEGNSPVTTTLLANQVTFALDRRPVDSNSVHMDNSHLVVRNKRDIMMDLFREFIEAKRVSTGGEFHVTVHTLSDLMEYWLYGLVRWPYTSLPLDMISISHINHGEVLAIDKLRTHIAPLVNWNLTIDPVMNMDTIKKTFPIIAEHIDSIYLVLHKPSTGQRFNPEAFEAHQDFLRFIRTQPQSIQDKVHVDGCITDSRKFLATGYGCSSNVSRFQVWPDGSVTGCAYNQNRVTPGADNLTELLKNLTQASKVYEFDRCKIPVHLDPQNGNVRKRSNHYLEIIE